MDYSSINEHEHGGSPWNTSPHQAPSGFGPEPDSPVQTMSQSVHTEASESETMAGSMAQSSDRLPSDPSSPEPTRSGPSEPQSPSQFSQQPGTYPPRSPYQQQKPMQAPTKQQQQQQQQQPQGQTQQRRQQQQQKQQPQYKLIAKITGLEGTGKKDMIVRFDAQTNLPKFRTTQFRDIRRTHAEFKKLAEHMISSNPEAMVPAVPPAVTSAGAGTEENEARVKFNMQKWLNTVCSNDILIRDDEMVFFIESDFGYSPVVRMKQPATGVRRKYLKQFAPPPDDTPELFDARPIVKTFYLGSMDAGQKVDRIVKARRGLGLAESDLGIKLSQMQHQESHPGLQTAYRKLGRTIQAVGDYHAAQGTAEAATLGDPLDYHSEDALIVKETLTNRHILLRDLNQAQGSTRSRLNAADRLKVSSSVRREKVDEAILALDEARYQERYLNEKCERVTTNLLFEKRKWFDRTAVDLRTAIRDYVLRQIEAERRALATLENVRPDIRSIDASGGLSRLGREQHPISRRTAMGSSQGPRGDAWSGVQRRSEALGRSFSAGVQAPGGPEGDEESKRQRAGSGASSSARAPDEDDDDRIDARNAASRLAQSTF